MRKTKPGFDRSSQTFADASEIIGSAPTTSKTHSIDIEMGDNGGVVVNHREKKTPTKGGHGDPYDTSGPRKQNVFSTPHEAHAHIGQLLGVKAHAPKAGAGGGGLT